MKSKKILIISILLVFTLYFCGLNLNSLAASETKKTDDIFYEDFTKKLDSSKWLVANKAWGGNNNGVVPENVYVDNGTLRLKANGNNYTGNVLGYNADNGKRTGSAIVTKNYYGSGSYEVKAKLPKELGACSAIWSFEYEEYYPGDKVFEEMAPEGAKYYVVNHEIDIEMPGRPDGAHAATDYNYALCNTFIGERGNEYTSNHVKLDSPQNDEEYHVYRYDWHTGSDTESKRVDFYIDNKLIATNTTNVPTHKGRFWIGIWFPNGWAGEANFDSTEFDVDYVKITPFNEPGDILSTETYPNDGWGDLDKVNYNFDENKSNNGTTENSKNEEKNTDEITDNDPNGEKDIDEKNNSDKDEAKGTDKATNIERNRENINNNKSINDNNNVNLIDNKNETNEKYNEDNTVITGELPKTGKSKLIQKFIFLILVYNILLIKKYLKLNL